MGMCHRPAGRHGPRRRQCGERRGLPRAGLPAGLEPAPKDDADLNARALAWCDEVVLRVSSAIGQLPRERWTEEKPYLLQLPASHFDCRTVGNRRVLREAMVSYRGNRYSAPPTWSAGSCRSRRVSTRCSASTSTLTRWRHTHGSPVGETGSSSPSATRHYGGPFRGWASAPAKPASDTHTAPRGVPLGRARHRRRAPPSGHLRRSRGEVLT